MAKAGKRRRRLSMTSLIDVIFLLLLFFMLSSTFSTFAEVELSAAVPATAGDADTPPIFVQLDEDFLKVNGEVRRLDDLAQTPLGDVKGPSTVLVSLGEGVNAQRLTDLLVALRALPDLRVTVLGA